MAAAFTSDRFPRLRLAYDQRRAELAERVDVVAHLDEAGVRVVFARPQGQAFTREWTWREVFTGQAPRWLFREPPPWLVRGEGVGPRDGVARSAAADRVPRSHTRRARGRRPRVALAGLVRRSLRR